MKRYIVLGALMSLGIIAQEKQMLEELLEKFEDHIVQDGENLTPFYPEMEAILNDKCIKRFEALKQNPNQASVVSDCIPCAELIYIFGKSLMRLLDDGYLRKEDVKYMQFLQDLQKKYGAPLEDAGVVSEASKSLQRRKARIDFRRLKENK